MSQVLLITRPNYDEATTYLFHWSKPVIKLAIKKGDRVVDLADKKANKAELMERLNKINPDFLFFNGHGNQTTVFGQDDKPLLSTERVVTTLLKGHSPEEADKRSKGVFQKNIQKLLTSETPKEYSAAIRFLFWDMKHQVCLVKR